MAGSGVYSGVLQNGKHCVVLVRSCAAAPALALALAPIAGLHIPLCARGPIVLAACWVTTPEAGQTSLFLFLFPHPTINTRSAGSVINFAKFIHFDKHLADDSRTQLTAFAYVFAAFMAMSEMSANTQHGHI